MDADLALVTHLEYVRRYPFLHKLMAPDGELHVHIAECGDVIRVWAEDPTEDEAHDGSMWTTLNGACYAVARVGLQLMEAGSPAGWPLLAAVAEYQAMAAAVLAAVPDIDPKAPVN